MINLIQGWKKFSAWDNSYDAVLQNLSEKKSWSSATPEQIETLQPILSNNTCVEWGSVETYDGRGFIGTDHKEGNVGIDRRLKEFDISIQDVSIRNHSHPDLKTATQDEGTKGGSNVNGNGDVPKFAKDHKEKGATYRAFVFHRTSGKIFEYDGSRQSIKCFNNPTEWKKDIKK